MTAALLAALLACKPDPQKGSPAEADGLPALAPPAPTLRRLTDAQYRRSIADLLGAGIVLPDSLEPDSAVDGLYAVGASVSTISPLGVELYEEAAYSAAAQAMEPGSARDALVPCQPADAVDAACAQQFVESFGRRAWRRPVEEAEADRLVSLAGEAAAAYGDFYDGLEFALAAILQSPHFLYRVELGEQDPEDEDLHRFTSWEMASRLSYFFWDTTPDDELLVAAEAGELTTDAGLLAAVERLMADDRARVGVRTFFTEMLELYALDDLNKDPYVFPHMSTQVGPSAREETLLGLEHLVFEERGDYRDIFTTSRAYLDRTLAAIYDVQAPAPEGFAVAWLDPEAGRRGLLGQVSFLAPNAHPVSSSATKRGEFIRAVLLCQPIPPPPADVDASIPEADASSPTLRERLEVHMADPSCAGCHQLMDPPGLGLENFDGIGRWRAAENGAPIDPSGELDGAYFADAAELGAVLSQHERIGPCLAETMFRYAAGHSIAEGEEEMVAHHAEEFADAGYAVAELMKIIALSPAFRRAGAVE